MFFGKTLVEHASKDHFNYQPHLKPKKQIQLRYRFSTKSEATKEQVFIFLKFTRFLLSTILINFFFSGIPKSWLILWGKNHTAFLLILLFMSVTYLFAYVYVNT